MFLPGMLVLGAHAGERERERHMWAANGLAYTCYLAYADQESGLGPDVLQMTRGGRRWVEALREWEGGVEGVNEDEAEVEVEAGVGIVGKRGREGVPPGLGEPARERNGTWVEKETKRDYYDYRRQYMLRPEVSLRSFLLDGGLTGWYTHRRSRVCFCCGRQRGMSSGESAGGRYLRRSRNIRGQSMGIRMWLLWMIGHSGRITICRGEEFCFRITAATDSFTAGFWRRCSNISICCLTIRIRYRWTGGFLIRRRTLYRCLTGQSGRRGSMVLHIN